MRKQDWTAAHGEEPSTWGGAGRKNKNMDVLGRKYGLCSPPFRQIGRLVLSKMRETKTNVNVRPPEEKGLAQVVSKRTQGEAARRGYEL